MANKPTSWSDFKTSLHDFVILTFYVNPEKVSKLIPEGFELYTVYFDNKRMGLGSLVSFSEDGLHLCGLPWFKFSFKQIDYRLYIKNKATGEVSILFIKTLSSSWLNFIPRLIWRLPWKSADITLNNKNKTYHLISRSFKGEDYFFLTNTYVPVNHLPGFNSLTEGLHILTGLTKGYYRRSRLTIGYYEVWHSPIIPSVGVFVDGELKSLKKYLDKDLLVHSVLITPKVEFIAYMPPKKYKLP